MKKITLLFLFFCFGYVSNAQLPETFDTAIPASWATFIGVNGEGTTENWEHNASGYLVSGFEAVTTISEDWLVTPQVSVTASASILTFDWTDYYTSDYGSSLTIRVSTATQTTHADFTTVATFTESDVITHATFQEGSVDLGAYIGNSVYIAFVHSQNDGDVIFLDNVDLVANATAPNPVTNPTPADGAVNVYIDPTDSNLDLVPDNAVAFDWDAALTGDPATSYDVYLGDSPTTLNLLGNTSNDQVNITGMQYSTLYYWQIVARNIGGEAVGSAIWSFTTEADPNLSVDEFDQNSFSHYYSDGILKLESSTSTFTNIEIYSISGQNVLSKRLSNSIENINLSELTDGIYLAKVNINGNSKTVKFIKN